MRLSVVGLGKLGACMAAAMASRGHTMVGVDVDEHTVAEVNARRPPVQEPGLEACMREHQGRLSATTDHTKAVLSTDATFVVVPTPTDGSGGFSVAHAEGAFKDLAKGLQQKGAYHLVVLSSTVLPGATRKLGALLERASGKRLGADWGLCYSPEFIALGNVIHNFLHPDFTLVGQHDEQAGAMLEIAYAEIMYGSPPCKRMTLENAELAKVALNSYVTMKMAFANMLADLCERLPDGDVDVVCDAIGTDRRIGHRYLKGASAYGGPCFPRDNLALGHLAGKLGVRPHLPAAVDLANGQRAARWLPHVCEGDRVAVLGLAYKPGTHVTECSHGMALLATLRAGGIEAVGHDPLAAGGVPLDTALQGATVVAITTPDPAWRALRFPPSVHTVVDYWRVLGHTTGFRYIATGRGPA